MPNNLVDTVENQLLDALHGVATFPAVTAPLKVRLMSALHASPEANAGTQVTGGTYAAQNMTMTAASGGSCSNTALIRFDGLPAGSIAAIEVYDNANTRRLWYAPLTGGPVTVTANQPLEFAAGSITFALD